MSYGSEGPAKGCCAERRAAAPVALIVRHGRRRQEVCRSPSRWKLRSATCFVASVVLAVLAASSCSWSGERAPAGSATPVAVASSSDGFQTVVTVTIEVSNEGEATIYRSTVSLQFETGSGLYAGTIVSDTIISPGHRVFVTREFALVDAAETPPSDEDEIRIVDAYFM